jgi:hypothetical protein
MCAIWREIFSGSSGSWPLSFGVVVTDPTACLAGALTRIFSMLRRDIGAHSGPLTRAGKNSTGVVLSVILGGHCFRSIAQTAEHYELDLFHILNSTRAAATLLHI